MRRFKLFAAIVAIAALIVATAVLFFYFYDPQVSDPAHLQRKADYLAQIAKQPRAKRPNIILILFDDMGYGDIGAFGNRAYSTPTLDRLARDGTALTNYYAPAPVCTPSRAATLTGRYALRSDLTNVLYPHRSLLASLFKLFGANMTGMPGDEILLPEILRANGYRTNMIGKWHLGDSEGHTPNNFGFDHFFGTLYSHDMQPLALYRDRTIAAPAPVDPTILTARYTEEATQLIQQADSQPFFLYLAHNLPHEPLLPSSAFKNRSGSGPYGDAIAELDDSTHRIVDALIANKQLDNTIIIITSDNGPWFEGSPGGRGRKGSTFEGGMRVPFIAHWPGHIASASTATPAIGIDILPTVLDYLGIPLPRDRQIDGISLRNIFEGGKNTSERALYYFAGDKLLAMRRGNFKYQNRKPVPYSLDTAIALPFPKGPWLFDLSKDPDESYNLLSAENTAQALALSMQQAREEFARNPRGWR